MLKNLHIKNFAIIDELSIDFEKGLNILIGETGAGKSIIIDAIGLAFGDRADKEQIKTGEAKAVIELSLSLPDDFSYSLLEENGIDVDESGLLYIAREITENSTRSRVNGVMVTQNFAKQIRKQLIDIHTQHETYTYINPSTHIGLLDNYGDEVHKELLFKFLGLHNKYVNTKKELEAENSVNTGAEQRKDFLEFQIKEIEEAQIENENEDIDLENQRKKLINAQELKDLSYSSYYALYGQDGSVIDVLSGIESKIEKASDFDEKLSDFVQAVSSAAIILREASDGLRDYSENLDVDGETLDIIEQRILLLDKIKNKHGFSLLKVIEAYEQYQKELEQITTSTDRILYLEKELSKIALEIEQVGFQLTKSRMSLASELSTLIQRELEKLEMPRVQFRISVERAEEFNRNGFNNVEFLISPNLGEGLKPLAKIASGGEISRIMLAIKTIFAKADRIETVIFDEIDTGISGKTSQAVAEEIVSLAKTHQVLCITHQPMIAAMADTFFYITKEEIFGKTSVKAYRLDEDSIKMNIAQMASGVADADSLTFADKLLCNAKSYKN